MLSDNTLREISHNGRYYLRAAQHLYQLSAEFKAEASFAELQGKAAVILAPETTEPGPGPDWQPGEESR